MAFDMFVSYSHKDSNFCKELLTYLTPLKHSGVANIWYDGDITPGSEWEQQIMQHLHSAKIILLLISADFIASKFCYSIEMKKAIDRHNAHDARVIPIILRPTYWKGAPFDKLKVLPQDGKPVVRWPTHDDAYENVIEGILAAIEELKNPPAHP